MLLLYMTAVHQSYWWPLEWAWVTLVRHWHSLLQDSPITFFPPHLHHSRGLGSITTPVYSSAMISVFASHLFLLSPATHLSPAVISRGQRLGDNRIIQQGFLSMCDQPLGIKGEEEWRKKWKSCSAATPKSPSSFSPPPPHSFAWLLH